MNIAAPIKERLARKREEAAQIEEAGRKAGLADSELRGLRKDLARLRERQVRFAALGDEPVTFSWRHFDPNFGEIEMQPWQSRFSGATLAANLQRSIDDLESEIAEREEAVAEFLADD